MFPTSSSPPPVAAEASVVDRASVLAANPSFAAELDVAVDPEAESDVAAAALC